MCRRTTVTVMGVKMVLVWEFVPFILRHYLQKSCRLITHGRTEAPHPSPSYVCGQIESVISIIVSQKHLHRDFNLHVIIWEAL